MKPKSLPEEERKLVNYFRSDEGAELGKVGDDFDYTPAETAIYYMNCYIDIRKRYQKIAVLVQELQKQIK